MSDERIRIATNIPSLKNKIRTDITADSTEAIYWYIRFNIPLDAASVSPQTMEITDTDGYIMRTDIAYDANQNRISICPLDSYEQGRFYLLNISTKVRSAQGQNLKTKLHILFKLYDNKVSEFKVLNKGVKVPTPKPRPANYDRMQEFRPPNRLDITLSEDTPLDTMDTIEVDFKIWPGIVALGILVIGIISLNAIFILITVGICMAAAVHIAMQLKNKPTLSRIQYNRGVRAFNRAKYISAKRIFEKSLGTDPNNDQAKYGVYKANLYT